MPSFIKKIEASLLPLFFLAVTNIYAQEKHDNYGQAYGIYANNTYQVFADTCFIRTSPNANAKIGGRLFMGDSVKLMEVIKDTTIGGKTAPWCSVGYDQGNSRRKGYIWAGNLSPRSLEFNGLKFLYGMRYTKASDSAYVIVKAWDGKKVIATCQFVASPRETANGLHNAEVLSNKGLKDFVTMLHFYFSGQACSIPTIEQYIGWDGSAFVLVPQISSVSEVGIFNQEQKIICPSSKGGKANEVIVKEKIVNFDENGKTIKKSTETTHYIWNRMDKTFVLQTKK
jgi:hypothetical protein